MTAVYEIIKKASRFTNDEAEVIAYADSRSEAEALAHDCQVNFYGPSAYITFRKAGESNSRATVPGSDLSIAYCEMTIEGFDGERFVVAKLRRISSPPVQVGTVTDPQASALGRLVDIIRLGRLSRNFADLKAIEWLLKEDFQTTAETEWAEYERVVCGSLGVNRLEPLLPTMQPATGARLSPPTVMFHQAEMNTLPYLVARVNIIFGSPAPKLMTQPHEQESALARLWDVFRVGVRGQVFRDFVEAGRRWGMTEAEIVEAWQVCEQALAGESDSQVSTRVRDSKSSRP
jgi:hypothetical protein